MTADSILGDEQEAVQNDILSLLEHSDPDSSNASLLNPDIGGSSYETIQLCENLLKSIQSRKKVTSSGTTTVEPSLNKEEENFIRTSMIAYNNKTDGSALSVRDVLGNLPSATTSKLAPLFAELMSDRVDVADLLPATQDDVANEEAMGKMAITLTKQAFLAAELYVELIGIPGAWGAGLIDVGTLSGLSALLRRWKAECCGNQEADDDIFALDGNKKRKPSSSKGNKNTTKRSKEQKRTVVADIEEDTSDDEESVDSFIAVDEEDGFSAVLSKRDLVMGGLRVSQALTRAQLGKEFVAWSCEAREAYVDSAVTALLTTAAMTPATTKKTKQSKDPELDSLRRKVTPLLSIALKKCFVAPSTTGPEDDDDEAMNSEYVTAERNHETSVAILRGLFPSFVLQMEVPNGQKGKEAAHALAVSTLEGITEMVAKQYELSAILSPSTSLKTPRKVRTPATEKSSTSITTPATTSRSSRKKRVSFFGDLSDVISPEKVAPPTLKLTSTPMRNRALVSTGLTPTQGKDRPRPVLSAVLGLLQKLATFKGLDRANIRSHIIDTLCKALPCLPLLERTCFLRFLIHLCHSKVSVHRLMCVDLVGKILSKPWLWSEHSAQTVSPILGKSPTTMTPSTRASFSPIVECSDENMPLALMRILQGRLVDRAPAVRARTAYALSEMLQTVSEEEVANGEVNSLSEFSSSLELVSNGLARKLRKRAVLDEGATVRKAAVNAFVDLIVFDTSTQSLCSEADISMLSDLCLDSSVAVRKAAADGLTILLLQFSGVEIPNRDMLYVLEEAWPTAIMPMVGDVEPTCVAKAVNLFYQTTIEPLVEANVEDLSGDSLSPQYFSAWHLLARVSERSVQEGAARGEYGALRTLIGKLSELYDEEVMQRLLVVTREVAIRSLEEMSSTSNSQEESQLKGSWCLLEAMADQDKKPVDLTKLTRKRSFSLSFLSLSLDKLFRSYQSHEFESPDTILSGMKSCMKVVAKWASHLHLEDAQQLSDNIKLRLRSFELPTDLVGSAITSLVALTDKISGDQTKQECSAWIVELNKSCENCIAGFVASPDQSLSEDTELVRAIYTVGELSMIGFRADEDAFSSSGPPQKNRGSTSCDPVAGLNEPPSERLRSLIQAMLSKVLPKSDIATPESARAHAFLTLGKLCLRNEDLAKSSLTLLVQELHQTESNMSPSVQSNALLVLGDLCVRYTNLVDRYLPVMARCLQSGITDQTRESLFDATQDQTSLVRKHAVLMLTGLLLQDYIKWRGLLFQRFLVATADRDEGVARLAEMSLCGPLLKKHPKLFFNNFVESLFVLNKCTAHPLYAAAVSAGDNGGGVTVGFEGINLSGEAGRAARTHIYATAISKMSSEEKIGITARLANDVLGAALETDGDLARVCKKSSSFASSTSDDNAYNVLNDAFFILTSPALQVARAPTRDDGEGLEETGAESKAQHVAAAKGKLLSKISRKQLVEMVLPILCNLKTTLQESCSPLLKDLMQYMVVIFRAYKVEVKEFLANEPTLLQEIEYDARQFKKAQRIGSPSGAVVVVSETEGE